MSSETTALTTALTGVRLETSYWPADLSQEVLDCSVGEFLESAVAAYPDRTALVEGIADPARRSWTYPELLDAARGVAAGLLGRFEPGERVAVWAPGIPEWEIFQLGAAMAGLVLVTANPAFRERELAYVLGHSGAVGVAVVEEYRGTRMPAVVESLRPELPALREVMRLDRIEELSGPASGTVLPTPAPHDPLMIQYTSGTTGAPKGAVMSHRSVLNNGRLFAERFGLSSAPVWVNPLPMFHVGGCVFNTMGTLAVGATHVLLASFDPGLLLELLERERGAFTALVPVMLRGILDNLNNLDDTSDSSGDRRDLSAMQTVMAGGAGVPLDLPSRTREELGADYAGVYGQTECSGVITLSTPGDSVEDLVETVGRPIACTEVRVTVPGTDEVVPIGEPGELEVRGFGTMLGYHDMPEETARTLRPDGWLRTGDRVVMDRRGYIRITGRIKDMIIRGGENIYPREIEDLLTSHPAVAEVAVVGIPDERWGEQVAAFVRPAGPGKPDEQELFMFVREHLAKHKTPRHWRFVDQFPTTANGKIRKFVLRDMLVADLERTD
jgi:fatty-acyl-CoA synthase